MLEVLLDSTTYIDLERANKHRRDAWAITTLRNSIRYQARLGRPYLSTISVAEIPRGLHRDINPEKASTFRQQVENDYNLLAFDLQSGFIGGEILAKLEIGRNTIGVPDCLIAAIAMQHGLTLVTSNTRHFQRIVDLGYPLTLENWREQ